MKIKFIYIIFFTTIFIRCHSTNKKVPNISNIRITLTLQRFEQDFFSIDTNQLSESIKSLEKKYPHFWKDFSENILGIDIYQSNNIDQEKAIRSFIQSYHPLKDTTNKIFGDFSSIQKEIETSFKYIKYYFPNYKLPNKLITFIGPLDAFFHGTLDDYGDIITKDAIGIALQLHMGKDYSLYKNQIGQALYPNYISKRFDPSYITVNCIKNIVDDIYPDNTISSSLINQIVDKGKRLYLVDQFMPNTPDSLKIGYTQTQLDDCYSHESMIWSMFLHNDILFTIDPILIKNYIGNSPNTPELGNDAPGNIGLFVGWQIVKKYMQSNTISLDSLLKTPNRTIFEQSHYKPK